MKAGNELTVFTAALREGFAPFCKVMPRLLREMAVSAGILLMGVGLIVLGGTRSEPASRVLTVLGEVVMIGGALFAISATVRAWLALFAAAGFLKTRREDQ